jgi:ABC-type branched-subunit amino acid transport system permease subunit
MQGSLLPKVLSWQLAHTQLVCWRWPTSRAMARYARGSWVTGATAAIVGMPALKLRGLAMATLGFAMIVYLVVNSETKLTGGSLVL